MNNDFNYRLKIKESFVARQNKKQNFSLRAFAQFLGIGKTTLNEVLAHRRTLNKKTAIKIAEKLAFSDEELLAMFEEIRQESVRKKTNVTSLSKILANDEFALISDWWHIAILCISQIENHSANPVELAKHLRIKTSEAELALETLKRLGLIKISRNKIFRSSNPIETETDIPSSAIRHYHSQNLDTAKYSLHNNAINERVFSSISIATNKEKLKLAEKKIIKFKEEMSKILSTSAPEEVYTIAVQILSLIHI